MTLIKRGSRRLYLLSQWILLPVGEGSAGSLLHPGEARTPNIGAWWISLAINHNHCSVVKVLFGGIDGWFDDPIGLSARAYILVPPVALDKSLLAWPYLAPKIKLLPNPWAYVLSSHWLLLSITKPHSHTPLWHINIPPQYTYALSIDWLPQSWYLLYPSVIPFMTLWHSHELWCLCSNYRLFVIWASHPTAQSPSLFFPSVQNISRITLQPAFLLRG